MSYKTKELILKSLLVLAMLLLAMLFPGGVIISHLVPDEKILGVIVYTILFSFLGVGVLFIVLLFLLGGLEQKEVKAERFSLFFNDYYELMESLTKSLKEQAYIEQKVIGIAADVAVKLYLKKCNLGQLDVIAIIRINELTNERLKTANDNITRTLSNYYCEKKIIDTINIISIFCVDRITPTFKKLVDGNLRQGLKNGRLNVGISFGGKKIYVAQQRDGFAIVRYKRARKIFCDIIGFPPQKT